MLRLRPIQMALAAEDSRPWRSLGWVAGFVLASTLLKLGLDLGVPSVPPFLTYFPAVTLAAMLLGARWGAVVLLSSVVVANYLFLPPSRSSDLSASNLVVVCLYLAAAAPIVLMAGALRNSARALQGAAERERLLNAELRHRVNNNLAVVQALASQTARNAPSPEAFYVTLRARLQALSEAHSMLARSDWAVCEMPQLAEQTLAPFRAGDRIMFNGPACNLPPAACVPLALMLHELGTNAVKYGALSRAAGHVTLGWRLAGDEFVLRWVETNGPPVAPPIRRGFGSRLLATQLGLQDVSLEFPPEGVRCRITVRGAHGAA